MPVDPEVWLKSTHNSNDSLLTQLEKKFGIRSFRTFEIVRIRFGVRWVIRYLLGNFGQALSYSIKHFSTLRTYGGQIQWTIFTVHFSRTSVPVRERLTCRKQFINIKRNDKNLDKFWDAQAIRAFFRQHFGEHWTRIGQDLIYVRALYL